jgi:dTDP-4-dehydrorhamnose reductase
VAADPGKALSGRAARDCRLKLGAGGMRIAVTGHVGQIVQSLKERAAQHPGVTVAAVGRPELDLAVPDSIAPALEGSRPDVIVNAAAYTAVDRAESEPQLAMTINRDGAAAVARTAAKLGIAFIQISTDYVFSGRKSAPYLETDDVGPLGVYGQTKLAGEEAVRSEHPFPIILRTAWVYSPFGANFVKTMLRLAGERDRLRIVDDQVGNPTSALDIAEGIILVAGHIADRSRLQGTFHMSGAGEISWCGFARQIFAISASLGGRSVPVDAISTSEYPTPAKRPQNSRLDNSSFEQTFGSRLPDWVTSVQHCVKCLIGSNERST